MPRALLALLSGRSDEFVRIAAAALRFPSLVARDQPQLQALKAATADLPEIFPGSVDVIVLTAREREVLGQLAAGRTVRQMADASFLSQNTIKSQLRTLYLKLGVSSRARALALAHEHRLLEDR